MSTTQTNTSTKTKTKTTAKTRTKIDHETFTLTFERTFSAPREDVFDAWTHSEQVGQWWDPGGAPLSECSIDLRPGGAFKFVNRGSAHSPPFEGVYRVIERPALLQFDAMGALGTVRLEETNETTHMIVTIKCASKEHLEQFVKFGVDVGTDRTLDNLGEYLANEKTA